MAGKREHRGQRLGRDLGEGRAWSVDMGNSGTFWILLGFTTIWRVLVSGMLDPICDEAYYWYWGAHPQLSYYDHPPLTGWLIGVGSILFGHTIWSIRIWPILAGVGVSLLARATASSMFDRETGNRAGILVMLIPGFLGNGILMTPDTVFMLMWALGVWCAWRAVSLGKGAVLRWALVGIVIGVGALSKYNMILFALSLCAAWFLGIGNRPRMLIGLVVAGVISILVFSPVLIWNMQNDWLSFRFQFSHGFGADKVVPLLSVTEYLGGLLLVASPVLAWQCFPRAVAAMKSGEPGKRYLAVFFWVVIAFFAVSAVRTSVGPNWPMLAFYSGAILVAEGWPGYRPLTKRLCLGGLALFAAIGLVGMSLMTLPLKWIDRPGVPLPRMEEFCGGEVLRKAVMEEDARQSLDFVCVHRYHLYAHLAYFCPELENRLYLHRTGILRFPWKESGRWDGRNALVLSWSESGEGYLAPHFETIEKVGEARIREAGGKKRRVLHFFKGTGYRSVREEGIPE